MEKIKCKEKKVWENIELHNKNPEYVKAVYEFILKSIS